MSASDRLERALLDAAESLMEVVGFPIDPNDEYGERYPVSGSLVNRDEVPDAAWRAAVSALQLAAIGYGITDPEMASGVVMSVEDGLEALTKMGEQP